jgi:hypothetical protein
METTKRSLLNVVGGVSTRTVRWPKKESRTHKGCVFSSPQLLTWRDLRSWRFWNKGIIDLAGDPMKCRERDSTLVTKDRTLIKALRLVYGATVSQRWLRAKGQRPDMMVVGLWNMAHERREGLITVQSDVLHGINGLVSCAWVAGASWRRTRNKVGTHNAYVSQLTSERTLTLSGSRKPMVCSLSSVGRDVPRASGHVRKCVGREHRFWMEGNAGWA